MYNLRPMPTARKRPPKTQASKHRSEKVQVPDSGEFKIAIISDTHSKAHPKSAEHVAAQNPDVILHGGDIGELAVLAPFQEIAPLHYVRGNIDPNDAFLLDSIDLSFERGSSTVYRLLLTHIAIYGPKLRADARRLAEKYDCSMVVCGHSHVPFIGSDRGISLINPGSIGPRRFGLPITFAMLTLNGARLDARHVCCESGKTWTP